MRAPLRSPRAALGLLATGVLLALAAAWPRARPDAAAAAPASGVREEGAQREFVRTRREQALIRAETTVRLLRALAEAPTLPGGGP